MIYTITKSKAKNGGEPLASFSTYEGAKAAARRFLNDNPQRRIVFMQARENGQIKKEYSFFQPPSFEPDSPAFQRALTRYEKSQLNKRLNREKNEAEQAKAEAKRQANKAKAEERRRENQRKRQEETEARAAKAKAEKAAKREANRKAFREAKKGAGK